MTVISGQVESLKRLKNTLAKNGVTRFNSIGDIKRFKNNYKFEREQIPEKVTYSLNKEIEDLELAARMALEKSQSNFVCRVIYWPISRIKKFQKNSLEKKYEGLHSKRCESLYKKLDFTKSIVDEQYALIAGAIGENKVVNELKKLSDDFYLINDFSLSFNPPIYNRKEQDRIASIQIDHLLVSQSGIFILETKNWSKASVDNLDLWSPVSQVRRANYALFVFLNTHSTLRLGRHHWGSKRIPIRNIIAMTNHKPKEEFQNVKVLSVGGLNGYIQYFEPVFTGEECESLYQYLKSQTI